MSDQDNKFYLINLSILIIRLMDDVCIFKGEFKRKSRKIKGIG